ncbi:C4-dicarboxylate ABC transporter [Leucobacter allii]|uniref:SLC13 family permease n=1 Tax=Leucobacter allii TaxID=2932247 RepID=UPI001FD54813|nr:SLC13 family permease [Leucobacter allii]UOR01157.1 C4-dicarboxylate ABC transporter [Leucobacter allii]
MTAQIIAISIFVVLFIVGTIRRIHLGAAALAAAVCVGLFVASETVADVLGGFPVSLMLLLLGVTYLISIAKTNGTLDLVVTRAVALAGSRTWLIPWVLFAISTLIASLGNPLAAMVTIPIALVLAGKNGLDPVVTGLAAINGSLAGCFAPTSLYGILTVQIAKDSGASINPILQFVYTLAVVIVLQFAVQFVFGRRRRGAGAASTGAQRITIGAGVAKDNAEYDDIVGSQTEAVRLMQRAEERVRLSAEQWWTAIALLVLIVGVIGTSLIGIELDLGTFALALAVILNLVFPARVAEAIKGIDWPTILLVGGIVTYVGVLQRLGAVDSIADWIAGIGVPLLAVFAICVFGGLVSAFASTTALIAVLIPLAVPLVELGGLPAGGVIMALAISSTLVDSSPFSTSGAIMVASSSDADRPRVTKALLRWGMSMVVVGPVITVLTLVVPGM